LRKGIALYVTLGLISLLSVVVMSSFDLIDKGFKHVGNIEKINQTRVVISDLQDVLGVLADEITDSDVLYALLGAYPPLSDEENRFSLTLEMRSMHKAININSILDTNKTEDDEAMRLKERYTSIFEYIFNTYQVRDGELLLNYILDTLDKDVVERDVDTEIALNDIHFFNGLISNRSQFDRILKEYQRRVDDKEIFNVPWSDFFYFSRNSDETIIDCTFMSRNLAMAMELEILDVIDLDEETSSDDEDVGSSEISCEMIDSSDNDQQKKLFGIATLDKNSSYMIEGAVSYSTNVVDDGFRFIYDLKSKRIVDIEVEEFSSQF
jgi:hypothetical protein